jgi:hypothetical protein
MCLTSGALAKTVEFEFDSANFPVPAPPSNPVSIANPYLPFLTPGETRVYVAVAGDECEIAKETISYNNTAGDYALPFVVDGVNVLVVRDQAWVTEAEDGECVGDAELQEDTVDFYAQQASGAGAGSVWYLGEETFARPDEGTVCSNEGAWTAGVDGALAGILMLDKPKPGDRYQQEFDEDNAEDMGAVLRKNGKVSIDLGDLSGCLVTREWSPLSPGEVEKKWYCKAQDGFSGGLALVEELKGKTLRVEYAGSTLPDTVDSFPGNLDDFPAFSALECSAP